MSKKSSSVGKTVGASRTTKVRKPAKAGTTRKAATLLVGIDLGTSRTAIAAGNGYRFQVSTYVGKPRDAVSEKLFGKRLLFGDEALNNRMSLELFRPLEKGVIDTSPGQKEGNIAAVQALLKHVVSLLGSSENEVIRGVIGAPARASVVDKKLLVDVVREMLDAVMIVSEPFCVAYGLDILTDALIVDIGAGTIDLCRMHGALPSEEDQATIMKGGDFIDRALFDLVKEKYPDAQFTINMIKLIKEKYGYVSDNKEKIEVEFTVNGRPRMFDVTEELKKACSMIVPDLSKTIYQLIGSFDPEFQKRLRNNVVACGGGSQLTGLGRLIERALDKLGGGSVTTVDEPVFAGASGALKIAHEMPGSFWERLKD
ncbi:MamK family actin-like protein [Candidatus Hydrogenedentota bacterium]